MQCKIENIMMIIIKRSEIYQILARDNPLVNVPLNK